MKHCYSPQAPARLPQSHNATPSLTATGTPAFRANGPPYTSLGRSPR
jgi:hypothetical protein